MEDNHFLRKIKVKKVSNKKAEIEEREKRKSKEEVQTEAQIKCWCFLLKRSFFLLAVKEKVFEEKSDEKRKRA